MLCRLFWLRKTSTYNARLFLQIWFCTEKFTTGPPWAYRRTSSSNYLKGYTNATKTNSFLSGDLFLWSPPYIHTLKKDDQRFNNILAWGGPCTIQQADMQGGSIRTEETGFVWNVTSETGAWRWLKANVTTSNEEETWEI